MYKFTIELEPGTRDDILARAPAAQAATRAEPGCIAHDVHTCTDDPDRPVLVGPWTSKEAHDLHMAQAHTRDRIAFHEPKNRSLLFETINA